MDVPDREPIAERVRWVLSRIHASADKVGRDPASVRLVAATKTVPVERIRSGIEAGLSVFGENRLQEAIPKIEALREAPIQWHFIGQLQRRKVRSLVGVFHLIHSVDSLELAQEVNRRAGEAGLRQDILLEVNVGGEPTKAGVRPDELTPLVAEVSEYAHIRVKGLMTIPPPTADAESARRYFRELRELARGVAARNLPGVSMHELSMGMSNDYQVAVEEGATLVRVGSAIFGARHA